MLLIICAYNSGRRSRRLSISRYVICMHEISSRYKSPGKFLTKAGSLVAHTFIICIHRHTRSHIRTPRHSLHISANNQTREYMYWQLSRKLEKGRHKTAKRKASILTYGKQVIAFEFDVKAKQSSQNCVQELSKREKLSSSRIVDNIYLYFIQNNTNKEKRRKRVRS